MALTATEQIELTELEGLKTQSNFLTPEETVELTELERLEQVPQGLTDSESRELAELERMENLSALGSAQQFLSEFYSGAIRPIKRAVQIQKEEATAGAQAIKEAFKDPSLKNVALGGLGALQYIFSPIVGAARGIAGEPVKEGLKAVGVPEAVAEFAGGTAETAAYFISPSYIVTGLRGGIPPAIKAAERLGVSRIKPLKEIIEKPKEVIPASLKPQVQGEFLTPQVSQKVTDDVARAATEALEGNVDASKRIFRQVSDALDAGEIQVEGLPEILTKHNINPTEFATMYRDTISTAGRQLKQLSDLSKRLKFVFREEPEAVAVFDDIIKQIPEPTITDRLLKGWRNLENFRRSLLVTQLATAMRNLWSQAGRLSISTFDEVMQGFVVGKAQGNTLQEMRNGLNAFSALYNRFSSTGRKRLNQILDANESVISKMRLFSQPVHEVALTNKVSKVLNTLNRTQEFFFRRIAFESKLRQLLNRKGLNFDTINPKHISQNIMEESVHYALEMTFAASPKSNAGRQFIKAWTQVGLTTVNPFPRFAFANAIPFLLEHSPLGYLKALSPKTLEALASGYPERFAKAASRATVGSLMFMSAMHIRQSDIGGEKWYEIKVGEKINPKTGLKEDKVLDTRAFAPLTTFLFMAEAFIHPERLKVADFTEAAIGLNRIAGTGLIVADLIRAKKIDTAKQTLQKFIGQYAGSFTVPFRTVQDLKAGIDPEEAILRNTRENPLIAPIIKNIPEISKLLPEVISPVETKRIRAEAPVLRQLTGLSLRTKNVVTKEMDRLAFDRSRIYPRTGVPKADSKLSEYMSPIIESLVPKLLNHPIYKKQSDAGKRIMLAELFKEARESARAKLMEQNPRLALKIRIEGLSEDIEKVLKERGINLKQERR